MSFLKRCFLLLLFLPGSIPVLAQSDSTRPVEIIRANSYQFKRPDSATSLIILAGDVQLKQGRTLFYADSLALNEALNDLEAFGNVHINDADSVHVYSQYLKYNGNQKLAQFRNKVKLTDGKATLFTEDMDYDLNSKTGIYRNGGRIENGETTLTSQEGYYYADVKDVYFKKEVRMRDPEYALATDTLLYNTETQVATFVAPTIINDGKSIIRTSEGFYDMKNGLANFGQRPVIEDSTSRITGDKIAYDKKSGNYDANGNVIIKDTAQGYVLISNQVYGNKLKKNILATQKPVMVLKQESDSIYIAADTLYSGMLTELDSLRIRMRPLSDTTNTAPADSAAIVQSDSIEMPIKDSLLITEKDSSRAVLPAVDSSKHLTGKDRSINIQKELPADSLLRSPKVDSLVSTGKDTALFESRRKLKDNSDSSTAVPDSVKISLIDSSGEGLNGRSKDSLRFIMGFYHVRIYSDSLQAVSDSLFYSDLDSVFRLYKDPVAWSKESQVTGDTIFLYTQNKKADKMRVWDNAMVLNFVENDFYNQLSGKTIDGYFVDGSLDFIRAKGYKAESIFYVQDEDSAYVGMNRAEADIIEMYFKDKEPSRVKFITDPKGILYPMGKIPADQKQLNGFKWLDNRRPKDKLELFQ